MAVRRQGNEILNGLNAAYRSAQGPQRTVTAGNAQVATGVAPNPQRPQPAVRQPASGSGKTGPNAGRPRVATPAGGVRGGALFAGRPNIGGYGQSGPFIPTPSRPQSRMPGDVRRTMPNQEAPLPPGADRRESGKIVYPRAPKAPIQGQPGPAPRNTGIGGAGLPSFPTLPPGVPPIIGTVPTGPGGAPVVGGPASRVQPGFPGDMGAQIPGGGYTGGTDVLRERMRNVAGQTPEQAQGVQGGPAGYGPRINPSLGSIEEGPGGSLVTLNEMGKQAYRRMHQDAVRRFGKWPGSENPMSPQPEIVPGQPMFNPFGTGWVD